ncbi:MAG TPA: SHOCT domain-containing protein [Ktedonobacterales bacterium]
MPMPMWGYYSAGYGWAGFFWMALSAAFWLALLGLLAWALLRWLGRGQVRGTPSSPPSPPPASALDVLQQRYARGELDEPTYLHMREQLEAPETQPREPAGAAH